MCIAEDVVFVQKQRRSLQYIKGVLDRTGLGRPLPRGEVGKWLRPER